MSFKNFVSTFWSASVQQELEANCFLAKFCNKDFEGEVKHNGRVKIIGVGRPTIGTYTGDDIGSPEKVDSHSLYMDIDQAKYYNFMVDDVDEAQSKGNASIYADGAGAGLAEEMEAYIAKTAAEGATKLTKATIENGEQMKNLIDKALTRLYNNKVSQKTPLELVLNPEFFVLFRDYLTVRYTDNMQLLREGLVGKYYQCDVRLSTSVFKDTSNYDHCFVRTQKAVGLAQQLNETIAFKPEGHFADAVRGLNVYGSKVVRKDQIVSFPVILK